jgi:transposase
MKTATTRRETDSTKQEKVLYVALELGKAKWRVGSSAGLGQKPRQVWVRGGHRDGLKQEIERAKKRFGLAAEAEVVCCYEAGREGFWLHRYLLSIAVNNRVVDSSSIEVNRRARRAKTDRLDVEKLLRMLIRYESGETEVWSVVRAPKVDEEDQKQLHRELMGLRKERTRQHNRITGLLYSQGVELKRCGKDFVEWLEGVKLWDGSALPQGLVERLKREYERLGLIRRQIKELIAERDQRVKHSEHSNAQTVRKMIELRGIGADSAWLYTMEVFGWRKIKNRRQMAALSGLVPSPYQSGTSSRDQGISKAGIRYVRAYAIESAWNWLRLQPKSELSRWYEKRFGKGSARIRKIGIVALARRLLIALWRYVEFDTLPKGALLKKAA